MTPVLDSGAVSALSNDRVGLRAMQRRGHWPPVVPAVVLAESLTGDHRRDHGPNALLRLCVIVAVDEPIAREAARLRTLAAPVGASAVDAIVVAVADRVDHPVVLTSDPGDISALASHARSRVRVQAA